MKKLLIAVLAFFACYSFAIAETFEYEASGFISDVQIAGPGTSANGLLAIGENFTVRFTIDTEEVQAIFDSYPDYEQGVYFQTYPIQAEFESGFSIEAIPEMSNGFGSAYHWKYLNFIPNFEFRMHNITVESPTEFVLSEPVPADAYGIELQFSEETEPFEILSGELGELPTMSDLDWANLYLRFVDYGDVYALTNYVGQIETVELLKGKKPKKEKQLVCHVGNEVGPNGETYLDNPSCIPSELNDYFCPDAGKIDLIVVAKPAKHLGNPSHSWGGISDYLPEDVGASGEGTEDSDGNGIDDGCEPIDVCPCWDVPELQSVTADNLYRDLSCSYWSYAYPTTVWLFTLEEPQADVMTEFGATDGAPYGQDQNRCFAGDGIGVGADRVFELTDQELGICVNQIVDRCAEIGDPVTNGN